MNRTKDDLELAREGDREAFWRLVGPHRGLIFATALGMLKDPEAAEDLLHETLLTAARSIGTLRDLPCLPAWLHTMTRNLALDSIRRQQRGRRAMAAAARQTRVIPVGEWVEKEAWLTTMEQAIGELPEPFRVILALKYINEYSYEQISRALGITLGAVRSRLFEARKLLKSKTEALAQAREAKDNGSRTV